MTTFDQWLGLIIGLFLLVSGVFSVIRDYKKSAKWWRWAWDIFGIILGAWFMYGCFFVL